MRKFQILINKSVYLGFPRLELSKIVIHEFRYDYLKPNYCEKAKLCYMDTGSFFVHVKTNDIYIRTLQKRLEKGLILQTMS